jgi:hypothetical protein
LGEKNRQILDITKLEKKERKVKKKFKEEKKAHLAAAAGRSLQQLLHLQLVIPTQLVLCWGFFRRLGRQAS